MWADNLLPQQKPGFKFLLNKIGNGGGAGLISTQGTGKTIVTLALLETLNLDNILIVCPLTSVDLTWGERLREALPAHELCVDFEQYKLSGSKKRILLVHYQLFVKLAKRLQKLPPFDIVVIDESQSIKARGSAQSRAARRLRHATRRLILSGTPIDKHPIDMFGQMRFVDHTVLGEKWGDFAEDWCRRGGYMGYQWVFRKRLLPQFLKKLEPYIFRLSLDSFNIPKPLIHLIPVELLGKQRRIYHQMEMTSIACVPHKVKADLPLTRKIKLEQITGGFIKDDENDIEIPVGNAKERKLRHVISKLKPPLVVTGKFLHDIEIIVRVLRERFKKVGILVGEVKGEDRTNVIRDFQAGKLDAIAVQVKTGGVSIELSHAHQIVIYSMNHSRIDFAQMISRLRRIGQKRQVEVFLILAIDTVDEHIRSVVEGKSRDAYIFESHFERRDQMAKKAKTSKKVAEKTEKKATAKPTKPDNGGGLGIAHLAKALDVTDTTARALLRKAGVKKSGKAYVFKNKEEIAKVVRTIERAGV